jgi:hypothetical protein
MSHTIDYSTIKSRRAKERAALRDCRQWLGNKKYREVRQILRQYLMHFDREFTAQSMCMLGVKGYPATAMVESVSRSMHGINGYSHSE